MNTNEIKLNFYTKNKIQQMKKLSLLLLAMITVLSQVNAQSLQEKLSQNRNFTGAQAAESSYKAIYMIDVKDPYVINKTLRNIGNALNDPRLKGKLKVELVAFSDGVATYLKSSPYEEKLKDLIAKGVTVVQCANTLKEKKMSRDQIFDFVGLVPSGNGELIIRQAEGWSVIKP